MLKNNKVYVNKSPIHGLGVFAIDDIYEGEIVEICPIMYILTSDRITSRYTFSWPKFVGKKQVIALGYGSLYNSSNTPNCDWQTDVIKSQIIFKAISDIKANEEITTNYIF